MYRRPYLLWFPVIAIIAQTGVVPPRSYVGDTPHPQLAANMHSPECHTRSRGVFLRLVRFRFSLCLGFYASRRILRAK